MTKKFKWRWLGDPKRLSPCPIQTEKSVPPYLKDCVDQCPGLIDGICMFRIDKDEIITPDIEKLSNSGIPIIEIGQYQIIEGIISLRKEDMMTTKWEWLGDPKALSTCYIKTCKYQNRQCPGLIRRECVYYDHKGKLYPQDRFLLSFTEIKSPWEGGSFSEYRKLSPQEIADRIRETGNENWWAYVTALRGPDIPNSITEDPVKKLFTCFLRGKIHNSCFIYIFDIVDFVNEILFMRNNNKYISSICIQEIPRHYLNHTQSALDIVASTFGGEVEKIANILKGICQTQTIEMESINRIYELIENSLHRG